MFCVMKQEGGVVRDANMLPPAFTRNQTNYQSLDYLKFFDSFQG